MAMVKHGKGRIQNEVKPPKDGKKPEKVKPPKAKNGKDK